MTKTTLIKNDHEEESDNDTINNNNFEELIQSINSGILALSPPPPLPSIPLLVPQQPKDIQEQSRQQSHIAVKLLFRDRETFNITKTRHCQTYTKKIC